ncbi:MULTISPECIES: hypothetical protein [unclassified Streptomyces]|uniref:hypothetical protein n=1 Tax=unclassified Streptomyces TaxID=2593676 RepID=UPI0036EEC349
MPTPERDPQQQSPSALSMKDLLASCAAAAAVSTPPAKPGEEEADGLPPHELPSQCDAAQSAA